MNAQREIFDANATLGEIRRARAVRRHRRLWGKSKLIPFRAELVRLRRLGASLGELVHWLETKKNVKAVKTTISRFLKKLPELRGNDHG